MHPTPPLPRLRFAPAGKCISANHKFNPHEKKKHVQFFKNSKQFFSTKMSIRNAPPVLTVSGRVKRLSLHVRPLWSAARERLLPRGARATESGINSVGRGGGQGGAIARPPRGACAPPPTGGRTVQACRFATV